MEENVEKDQMEMLSSMRNTAMESALFLPFKVLKNFFSTEKAFGRKIEAGFSGKK
jgi:hypothetical protein